MSIPKFKDFDSVRPYGDYQPLPTGAYILRIMDAKYKTNENGGYVHIRCDIADGEYKDFFMNDYHSQEKEDKKWHCNYLLNVAKDDGTEQDSWTKRRFKTFTDALEDSNSGYHFDWDETKFSGKLIGGLFNIREYKKPDGTVGRTTNLAQVCSVEKVRSGNYKLPKDKLLNESKGGDRSSQSTDDFMSIPDTLKDSIPWEE